MTDLTITITDHRVRRRLFGESAEMVFDSADVPTAFGVIFDGIEARKPDAVLCQALYEHPELCGLAACIHLARQLEHLEDSEALPLLTTLRSNENHEWVRAMAGRELARRGVRA